MATLTKLRLSRTLAGAVLGALVALMWLVFDTGAAILFLGFTATGGLIGLALDRPEQLIKMLEKLKTE